MSSSLPVGELLRGWRQRPRLSQLDLAGEAAVSTRHLSYVETGRSLPSREMLLRLAERLEVPLRERNRLLLAAGYAPRYAEHMLDEPALEAARAALQRLLAAHDPYPGLVLDRQWNVVLANRTAHRLTALLPEALRQAPLNIFRASLHPQGFAALTANFDEWGGHLLDTLQRVALRTGDPGLLALEQEVLTYPNVQSLRARRGPAQSGGVPQVLLPCIVQLPSGMLSMFTTLTTFGSPHDVTLAELCVELFYPSDAASETLLRAMPD